MPHPVKLAVASFSRERAVQGEQELPALCADPGMESEVRWGQAGQSLSPCSVPLPAGIWAAPVGSLGNLPFSV